MQRQTNTFYSNIICGSGSHSCKSPFFSIRSSMSPNDNPFASRTSFSSMIISFTFVMCFSLFQNWNSVACLELLFLYIECYNRKKERSIHMDIKEFIERYINSSAEIQESVEQILRAVQQQIESPD